MDRLLIIEPRDLIFTFELGKKHQATIKLKNVMHTMPVAFNVQPNAPKWYTIKPAHGIILPLEDAVVTITLLPQSEVPKSIPYSTDKFVVKSVVVPGGTEYDPVPLDWFTANKKQVYSDHGIRVFFIGGCILRKLVDVGSMEDTRQVLEFNEKLVDSKDEHGSTALHVAVARGRPDLVQLLLEFRADVNVRNKMGRTALHEAAMCGEALIAELLVARGANVHARTLLGHTALYMAVCVGHADTVKLLVENGSEVNALTTGDGTTLVHRAVNEASHDCLEILLQNGANVNAKAKENGEAPLHLAVAREDKIAMEILIRHGACKEVKNKSGKTPADLAQEKGQQEREFFEMLGIGDNLRSASRKGNVVDVQESLRKGEMLAGEEDEHGWTALHRAAFKGHIGVVRVLLEAGVDLNCQDDAGYTPLHCAAEAGHKDIVKLLLKHGAPVNARTCTGITALDLAAAFQHTGTISLLLECGGCSRKGSKATSKGQYRKGEMCVGQHVDKDVKGRQKGRNIKDFFGFSSVKKAFSASTNAAMSAYVMQ